MSEIPKDQTTRFRLRFPWRHAQVLDMQVPLVVLVHSISLLSGLLKYFLQTTKNTSLGWNIDSLNLLIKQKQKVI